MTEDLTAPKIKPADTGNPLDETVDYVVAVQVFGDNRGVTVQERTLVSGVLPRGFTRFMAATEFPVQDRRPPAPPRMVKVQIGFDSESVQAAFQTCMPLLVAEMGRRVKQVEDAMILQQVQQMAGKQLRGH